MADRKMGAVPGDPTRVHITVNPDALPNFPDQARVTLVLHRDYANTYDVFQKDIPAELRGKQYNGKPIRWLNNFGLKQKGAAGFENKVPDYTVILDALPGAEYVFHDGSSIQVLKTSPVEGDPTKVQATLKLGDPSVGRT